MGELSINQYWKCSITLNFWAINIAFLFSYENFSFKNTLPVFIQTPFK